MTVKPNPEEWVIMIDSDENQEAIEESTTRMALTLHGTEALVAIRGAASLVFNLICDISDDKEDARRGLEAMFKDLNTALDKRSWKRD